MSKRRVQWIDGIRGLAILWVLFVHAVTIFTPNENADFPGLLGKLLYGISGKLAVACCCVILGYFASESRPIKFVSYAIKRSVPFMIQVLIIEVFHYVISLLLGPDSYMVRCNSFLLEPTPNIIKALLSDALLLSEHLIPTFWCIDDFVLASLLVFLMQLVLQKQKLWLAITVTLTTVILLYLFGFVWLSAGVMGYLLRLLLKQKINIHPLFWSILLLPIPWLIRRGECPLTYFYNGIACLLLIYVVFQWPPCQKIFAFPPFAFSGTVALEAFMLHVPIFELIRSLLSPLYSQFSLNTFHYALLIIPAMITAIGVAWLWHRYITSMISRICQVFALRFERLSAKSNGQVQM
ncbi:MAG: hypothetical protein J6K73_14255 [Clostridia bacterium]|nr:hypothetical protein [Clostridia bacterium]